MDFGTQIDYLLVRPPGSLLYHLVLAFSVVGALVGAFNQWRSTEFPQARRTVIGLMILLLVAIGQYLIGVMSFQVNIIPESVLPPLDRAIMVINLALIIWLWAFPEPVNRGDAATILIGLLAVVGFAFSALLRIQSGATDPYNNTYENLAWEIFTLALAAIGGLILVRRQPAGWNFGLTALIIIFLGVLVDTMLPTPADGHYSIFVRVATMSAYPMLLTLPQRYPTPTEGRRGPAARVQRKVSDEEGDEEANFQERRRYSTDPKTLHALLLLAAETNADKINQTIARAVSQSMLADLSFIIYVGEDKRQLTIASGYDLIREENLEGGLLNRDNIPMLASALTRGKPLRLPASTTSSDLKGLGDMLGLSSAGNLLNVPILSDGGPVGGILVLSPYSSRMWSAEDQIFLTSIAESFVPIIERGRRIANIENMRDQAENRAQEAQMRIADAENERRQAQQELEEIKEQTKDARQNAEELAATLKIKEELDERVKALESELNELRADSSIRSKSDSQMENELRQTLKEVAKLQNTLAEANIRILELESGSTGGISNEQAEVVASIAQELRQPMSSIVGYTDLLLSESVGILGALQRKFIERIKASTDRIDNLINDLIQLTSLESGGMSLKPETVDLNLIIDNAMAYTSSQLREKNITLRIDLPQTLVPVHADREALQQILIHLLQNAGSATPIEGTITLRVRNQDENGQEFILIQVSDTGGGIPETDLPRVFSRLYRADNVLIQGVGDTGVGLSLAKTLTEAQGGRIWVDSEQNVGSTFHVLLPVKGVQPAEDNEE